MRARGLTRLAAAAFTLSLVAGVPGCGHPDPPRPSSLAPAVHGDSAHPANGSDWLDTRLYFGLGPADHPEQGISEHKWREFLDREVTPRFPDGLSVQDVYGQWRGKGQAETERERSKVLIIDYPDTAENRAKVEAIRAAWKKMTGDESVLRVTVPAGVSF